MSIAALQPRRVTSPEAHAFAAALQRADAGAVVWISIEDHDRVQATLGEPAAARRMEAIFSGLRMACRQGDDVLQRGPSGFIVVAARVRTVRAAQGLASRLLQSLDGLMVDGSPQVAQASMGVCFFPTDAAHADEALRKARLSALQARTSGRPVCFYAPCIDAEEAEAIALTAELIDALQRHRFEVVYQPKFSLRTGALQGAEALVRWTSPTRGAVSPARFVPLLERLGRVEELTQVVLRHVAEQVARWHPVAPEGFRVSVNLSGGELRPGRGEELLAVLAAAGTPATRMEFEVTESVLMRGRAEAVMVLETLRAAGATLAIDDFGTGYSSLGYLASLPVQTVKVDRSFIRDLHRPNVRALLKSVVGMVHALSLKVTVEGVESAEQLDMVRAMGADCVQGFLTGRPAPAEALTRGLQLAPSAPERPHPVRPSESSEDLSSTALPLLASGLHRLCELQAGSPEPDAVVELAMADPSLGLFILQMSRQGARRRTELPSLSQAVLQVGAQRIVQSVLAGTTRRVFLPGSGAARLWTHSIEVACWSAALASACVPHVKAERAYFAGLLHDIGRFVLLEARPLEALSIEASGWRTPAELLVSERRTLDADHAVIGALEARARGLSEDVVAVIEHHHAPAGLLPASVRDLVAIVQAADTIAVMQEARPELGESGPIARAVAIQRLLAPLRLPWPVDCDALSALWTDVAAHGARVKASIGL